MINATQLKVGNIVMFNKEPHRITKTAAHHARQLARDGSDADGEPPQQQPLRVPVPFRREGRGPHPRDSTPLKYMYRQGDEYHFMNTETFELMSLRRTSWATRLLHGRGGRGPGALLRGRAGLDRSAEFRRPDRDGDGADPEGGHRDLLPQAGGHWRPASRSRSPSSSTSGTRSRSTPATAASSSGRNGFPRNSLLDTAGELRRAGEIHASPARLFGPRVSHFRLKITASRAASEDRT